MSATLKHLNTGQRRFQDAKGMFVTPYTFGGLLGETTYDIHDIVGDTLSITADDPDRTEISWEFGDTALDENVKMGKMNFACQCLDFQNDIMLALFGCKTVNDAVVFPSEYEDLYVMIRIKFDDVDLVLPYVKMNSKATLENMRTDIARGELAGTILSKEVVVGGLPAAGDQAPTTAITYNASNAADTPMLYLPNDSTNGKAAYVPGTGTTSSSTVYLTDVHADAA